MTETNTYNFDNYFITLQLFEEKILFYVVENNVFYEENLDIKYFSPKYSISETYMMLKGVFEKKDNHTAKIIKAAGCIKFFISINFFNYFIVEFNFNIKKINQDYTIKKLLAEKETYINTIEKLEEKNKIDKDVLLNEIETYKETIKKLHSEKALYDKVVNEKKALELEIKKYMEIIETIDVEEEMPEIIINMTKIKTEKNFKSHFDNFITNKNYCIYAEYNTYSNIFAFSNGIILVERISYGKQSFEGGGYAFIVDNITIGCKNINLKIKFVSFVYGLFFGNKGKTWGDFSHGGALHNGSSINTSGFNYIVEGLKSLK